VNYLLDTCVISELVKPAPHEKVVGWLTQAPSDALFLSVITIGEIRKGLIKLKHSKRKLNLMDWLNMLLDDYRDRILSIDLTVAENWGILQGKAEQNGSPMASIDGLIAATAYTHNLALITRNEKDFAASGVHVINPWSL